MGSSYRHAVTLRIVTDKNTMAAPMTSLKFSHERKINRSIVGTLYFPWQLPRAHRDF
jgi:GMP synthase PP-ATPase subunit